ncbi:MAG: hypothetical protein ACMG51_06085, partial [Ginsengibacter sp.]
KMQQYAEQQNRPTPGEFGYLHDAGRQQFASLGQQLGQGVDSAIKSVGPPGAPQLNPQAQVQQAQSQAVMQASQVYKQLIAAGQPENVARQTAAKIMVQAGVPGASEQLQKAGDEATKNAATVAETAKNTAQAGSYGANAAHQSFEEGGAKWHYVSSKDGVDLYKNENGEPKVVTTQPSKTLPESPEAAAVTADNAKKVANYQMSIQEFLGRKSGPERQTALAQVYAANPSYVSGDYAASNSAYKAFTSGKLGDSARFATNVAAHTLALDQAHDALATGGVAAANAVAQEFGRQLNDPKITSYSVLQDIVADEGVKALIPNAGTGKDRDKAVANYAAKLSGPALKANTAQLRGAVGVQYNNLARQFATSTKRKDFHDLYQWPGAGADGSAPIEGAATTTQTPPPAVGTARGGYVFKGGDPSNQASWVKGGP